MVDDSVLRLPGSEDHRQPWNQFPGTVGQGPAIEHAGHHHIGEQQIDLFPAVENCQRLLSVGDSQHAVSKFGQLARPC